MLLKSILLAANSGHCLCLHVVLPQVPEMLTKYMLPFLESIVKYNYQILAIDLRDNISSVGMTYPSRTSLNNPFTSMQHKVISGSSVVQTIMWPSLAYIRTSRGDISPPLIPSSLFEQIYTFLFVFRCTFIDAILDPNGDFRLLCCMLIFLLLLALPLS